MKFKIIDDSGEKFEVEESLFKKARELPKKVSVEEEVEEVKEVKDEKEVAFTEEEISALKDLAKVAGELVGLLKVEKEEHDEETFDEEKEDDEEEAGVEQKDEEVIETSEEDVDEEDILDDSDVEELEEIREEKETHDSKSSFGSIESKVSDSVDDSEIEMEIAEFWRKRYENK